MKNSKNKHANKAKKLTCPVCPRHCVLTDGTVGFCAARQAKNGETISINYSKITSFGLDPIEKKPLYYFCQGQNILSVGSFGCNMNCNFCQNYSISRAHADDLFTRNIAPVELVALALSFKDMNNCGIAFTYNEPLIGYEYLRDTAKLAREQKLETVVVTNGQICQHYLDEVKPYITAWNIDLKCFNAEGYQSLGGDFATTKNTIKECAKDAHVEITTLVVPGLSDSKEEMDAEAKFIAAIDPEIPLHLSRYFPNYKSKTRATDIYLLKELQAIASKHLKHVILGNV